LARQRLNIEGPPAQVQQGLPTAAARYLGLDIEFGNTIYTMIDDLLDCVIDYTS